MPIKIALEWLEGANHQLEQQWGNKDFSQLSSLIMRDASGLQGDDPLQGEDPYSNLNQDLIRAFDALNLRRLSRHISTLLSRDLQLSMATPHKHLKEKATRRAKKYGSTGGQKKAAKNAPLREEIKRLYQLGRSKPPKLPRTEHASNIAKAISAFIDKHPGQYGGIGSSTGLNGSLMYYNFVYDELTRIDRKERERKTAN